MFQDSVPLPLNRHDCLQKLIGPQRSQSQAASTPLADSDSATWDLAPTAAGGYIVTWLQGGILSPDSDSDAWDIAPAAAAAARCELMASVGWPLH